MENPFQIMRHNWTIFHWYIYRTIVSRAIKLIYIDFFVSFLWWIWKWIIGNALEFLYISMYLMNDSLYINSNWKIGFGIQKLHLFDINLAWTKTNLVQVGHKYDLLFQCLVWEKYVSWVNRISCVALPFQKGNCHQK